MPDPDDRHILAAAIRCQATVIVKANFKDFPTQQLAQFDVEAQHPDVFIANLIDRNSEQTLAAFCQQVSFLKNLLRTAVQILDNFRQVHLTTSADKLTVLLSPASE